jgi:hypothetical protein
VNVTTRYRGRFEKLGSARGPARARASSDDFIDRPSEAVPAASPTPVETLERLLDTHNWLRARKGQ